MARKPRIHLSGGLYHVIFRGNGGQSVFLNDEDRYASTSSFKREPVNSATVFTLFAL